MFYKRIFITLFHQGGIYEEKEKKTTAELLSEADGAINGALRNPAIIEKVSTFGYNEEKLKEGKELYETALHKSTRKVYHYGNLFAARRKLKEVLEKAKKRYYRDLKIARIVFNDDNGSLDKLEARGSRKLARGGWLTQANVFYHNAVESPQIREQLTTLNLTMEILEEGKTFIEEVEATLAEKEARTGDARNATKERNMAIKQLKRWVRNFKAIVFIVYNTGKPDDAQEPERLGWVVKSQ